MEAALCNLLLSGINGDHNRQLLNLLSNTPLFGTAVLAVLVTVSVCLVPSQLSIH